MKLLLVCGLIAVAVADRLDNTYLPPSNSKTAGGNGNFLSAPFGSGSSHSGFGAGAASKNYLPPNRGSSGFGSGSHSGATSKNYLPPSTGGNAFGRTGGNYFGGASKSAGAFGSSSGSFGARKSTGSFGSSSNSGFGHKSTGSFGSSSNSGFARKSTGSFGASSGSFGSSGYAKSSGRVGAGGFGAPSTQYGAPAAQYGAPSTQYGAPSGARFGGAQSRDAGAAIVRSNNENNGDGSYRFDFETENKISQNEAGELKNAGSDYEASSVQGSYTYTGDDGQTYTVNYIADENGFQPIGQHLPTPPPVPEAIQKSLAQIAQQGGSSQGGYQHGSGSGHGNGFQSASRQYLTPNKPSFNSQSGYQY